ncbi:MAG TPA: MFS transporter [Ilumatobacteraceae bacterium]|nr:MFS transporter [Ilumatobacteraceae bacterium]HRB03498.1 MFS transporter [Ilumatobacteraceae bacterium]
MGEGTWSKRDFRLVLGGGFVNNVGDWLLAVALPSFVYVETGSGRTTAAIVIIELLVSIAWGPVGGSLVDRWDLRRTVIATNVLQALCLLPLLAVSADRLWPAFVVAVLQGGLREVNDPASFAMVPRIVPADHLNEANASNAAAGSFARLIGSPLGGIAVAAGGLSAVVIADGATFLVVAGATWFVTTPTPSLATETGPEGDASGVRSGWQQVRRYPRLVGYLTVHAVASWSFAMFPVLFIAFVIEVLRGDEATVGFIRGMAAFGGLVAAYAVGRRARRVDPATLMMWGYGGLGFIAFVFVNVSLVTTSIWLFLALFALSGLPNMTSQIGATGTAQRLCPPELLGRFQGLASAAGAAGAIGGSVVVGLLISHENIRLLLNVQATLYILCGLITFALVIRPRGCTDAPADG